VNSAWLLPSDIVGIGLLLVYRTELSSDVEAVLRFPTMSSTSFSGSVNITISSSLIPCTVAVNVLESTLVKFVTTPVLPVTLRFCVVNVSSLISFEKIIVNFYIGRVGLSFCLIYSYIWSCGVNS